MHEFTAVALELAESLMAALLRTQLGDAGKAMAASVIFSEHY